MKPMTVWRALPAALKSLVHFRRHALGTAVGALLASVLLTGSLLTGASVRLSLAATAARRLGAVEFALEASEDFFTVALAARLAERLKTRVAPVLRLSGLASRAAGAGDLRRVELVGVDDSFFPLFGDRVPAPASGACVLGEHAAAVLGAAAGDEVVLKIEKRSLLPLETPAGRTEERFVPLRVRIASVASKEDGGAFSLRANQTVPLLVFLPLAPLGRAAGLTGLANILLAPARPERPFNPADLNAALRETVALEDYGLRLDRDPVSGAVTLRDQRLFIRPAAAQAARALDPDARGRLVYFANRLAGAPYSFIAAAAGPALPFDPGPDGMFVSDWLAADQGLRPGSVVTVSYFVVDASATLTEREARFTVRGVLPLSHPLFDARLTPDFPGLTDVPNCRDWRAGVPVDVTLIRKQDEDFWNRHKAAPKAVISLERGRALWGNRFGEITSLRSDSAAGAAALTGRLRDVLDPALFGLAFSDVRADARAAADSGVDFTGLFTGLSFFAVAASLILSLFLFSSAVAQRGTEIGLLRAVGLSRVRIFVRLGLEGALTALVGSLAGMLAGPVFTACLIALLATVFSGAVAGAQIGFYFSLSSFVIGGAISFAFSLIIFLASLIRYTGRHTLALLSGTNETAPARRRPRMLPSLAAGGLALVGALVLILGFQTGGIQPVVFFISSALLFAGLLFFFRAFVVGRFGRTTALFSGTFRRAAAALRARGSRTLYAVLILALGVYLVTAVGANTSSLPFDLSRRDTGTGGFAFFVETAVPVPENLNDPAARVRLGLDGLDQSVFFLPLRVNAGDDSSCLNLNRAQQPELVGLPVGELAVRRAFVFSGVSGDDSPWTFLEKESTGGSVPVIADEASLTWGLGLAVGDYLRITDENGRERELRFAAALQNSLFQGCVLVSEKKFLELFPSSRGYLRFLVDAPGTAGAARGRLEADIENALRNYGAQAVGAAEKLQSYQEVTNTYLLMFLVLGGLGLLIGLGGFGVFIRKNAVRRAGEFALLSALGFSRRRIFRQFLTEQLVILFTALVTGLAAAGLALLPAFLNSGGRLPWPVLLALVAGMGGGGWFWTRHAVRLALRGDIIGILKKEAV